MEYFKNNRIWRYSYVFWVLLYQNGKYHDRLIYQVSNLGEPLVHENINPLPHTFTFILSLCRYRQTYRPKFYPENEFALTVSLFGWLPTGSEM